MMVSPRVTTLLPQHRGLISASAISSQVLNKRGYRSVQQSRALERLGFNERQSALVPGLLIPIHDVFGKNERHQFRPDNPRRDAQSGKPLKYENVPGVGVTLDVHPLARGWVQDARRDLYITEGIRKGDAAVSHGLACIALLGVWNWRGTDESGSVMALGDWEAVPLKGRNVYVVFDSDIMEKLSVKLALERLVRFLERRGALVQVIYLSPAKGGGKQGLDDWFAAGGTIEGLVELAEDGVRGLPEIIVNGRPQRDITADALNALVTANDPPQIYRRSQTLVRVLIDENERPFINAYDKAGMKNRLTAVADFYRVYKEGDRSHQPPPDNLAADLLAAPEWPFPTLDSIVEAPTLRPDGSVLEQPGYDPPTRLIYIPGRDLEVRSIRSTPSAKDVGVARRRLLEVVQDFPFVDDTAKANALGLMLTPVLRPAISGPVPMALIDAPQAGTGKGLLARAVSVIATGRDASMTPAARDDEEWRKRITALLRGGASYVVIDNIEGNLESAALAAALTAETWSDRVLGVSETVELPQRAVWVATGNNVRLMGDLARRTYRVRLNAETARPWLREGFEHPQLLAWVAESRNRLLGAILVLARAWFADGCPEGGGPSLGSYEEWSRVVGGVLASAGLERFLDDLDEMYADLDPEAEQWERFLVGWERAFKARLVSTAEFVQHIEDGDDRLRDALPDALAEAISMPRDSATRRIGKALSAHRERRYGAREMYLVSDDSPDRNKLVWGVRV